MGVGVVGGGVWVGGGQTAARKRTLYLSIPCSLPCCRQPRGSGGAAYLASTGRIYLVGGCLSSLRDSSASVLRFVAVWVCRCVGLFVVCGCVAVVEWLWRWG